MKNIEKMSKKEKKAYYKKYRNTWEFSPVTRREEKRTNNLKLV